MKRKIVVLKENTNIPVTVFFNDSVLASYNLTEDEKEKVLSAIAHAFVEKGNAGSHQNEHIYINDAHQKHRVYVQHVQDLKTRATTLPEAHKDTVLKIINDKVPDRMTLFGKDYNVDFARGPGTTINKNYVLENAKLEPVKVRLYSKYFNSDTNQPQEVDGSEDTLLTKLFKQQTNFSSASMQQADEKQAQEKIAELDKAIKTELLKQKVPPITQTVDDPAQPVAINEKNFAPYLPVIENRFKNSHLQKKLAEAKNELDILTQPIDALANQVSTIAANQTKPQVQAYAQRQRAQIQLIQTEKDKLAQPIEPTAKLSKGLASVNYGNNIEKLNFIKESLIRSLYQAANDYLEHVWQTSSTPEVRQNKIDSLNRKFAGAIYVQPCGLLATFDEIYQRDYNAAQLLKDSRNGLKKDDTIVYQSNKPLIEQNIATLQALVKQILLNCNEKTGATLSYTVSLKKVLARLNQANERLTAELGFIPAQLLDSKSISESEEVSSDHSDSDNESKKANPPSPTLDTVNDNAKSTKSFMSMLYDTGAHLLEKGNALLNKTKFQLDPQVFEIEKNAAEEKTQFSKKLMAFTRNPKNLSADTEHVIDETEIREKFSALKQKSEKTLNNINLFEELSDKSSAFTQHRKDTDAYALEIAQAELACTEIQTLLTDETYLAAAIVHLRLETESKTDSDDISESAKVTNEVKTHIEDAIKKLNTEKQNAETNIHNLEKAIKDYNVKLATLSFSNNITKEDEAYKAAEKALTDAATAVAAVKANCDQHKKIADELPSFHSTLALTHTHDLDVLVETASSSQAELDSAKEIDSEFINNANNHYDFKTECETLEERQAIVTTVANTLPESLSQFKTALNNAYRTQTDDGTFITKADALKQKLTNIQNKKRSALNTVLLCHVIASIVLDNLDFWTSEVPGSSRTNAKIHTPENDFDVHRTISNLVAILISNPKWISDSEVAKNILEQIKNYVANHPTQSSNATIKLYEQLGALSTTPTQAQVITATTFTTMVERDAKVKNRKLVTIRLIKEERLRTLAQCNQNNLLLVPASAPNTRNPSPENSQTFNTQNPSPQASQRSLAGTGGESEHHGEDSNNNMGQPAPQPNPQPAAAVQNQNPPPVDSFFKRHWGKILVGGLIGTGLVLGGVLTGGLLPAVALGIAGVAAVSIVAGAGIGIGALATGGALAGTGAGVAAAKIPTKEEGGVSGFMKRHWGKMLIGGVVGLALLAGPLGLAVGLGAVSIGAIAAGAAGTTALFGASLGSTAAIGVTGGVLAAGAATVGVLGGMAVGAALENKAVRDAATAQRAAAPFPAAVQPPPSPPPSGSINNDETNGGSDKLITSSTATTFKTIPPSRAKLAPISSSSRPFIAPPKGAPTHDFFITNNNNQSTTQLTRTDLEEMDKVITWLSTGNPLDLPEDGKKAVKKMQLLKAQLEKMDDDGVLTNRDAPAIRLYTNYRDHYVKTIVEPVKTARPSSSY